MSRVVLTAAAALSAALIMNFLPDLGASTTTPWEQAIVFGFLGAAVALTIVLAKGSRTRLITGGGLVPVAALSMAIHAGGGRFPFDANPLWAAGIGLVAASLLPKITERDAMANPAVVEETRPVPHPDDRS